MMGAKRFYSILLMFFFHFSNSWQKSLKDMPEECFTATEIDDNTRAFENFRVPTSKADDLDLKKGWYRIMGKSANSLKQGFDKSLVGSKSDAPNFCGTVYSGTLMGEHPTVDEGMVEMTVCFRKRFCYYDKIEKCECKSNKTIYVRNCINHYIYWLSPTGRQERYCTGKTRVSEMVSTQNVSYAVECRQHKTFEDNSRVWDKISDVTHDEYEGWYRFSSSAGLELASACTVNTEQISRLSQPCGATFRGWMVDRHPTLAEGRVNRKICFSYANECSCVFFTNAAVRNCGTFYVYRIQRPPVRSARYCGASQDLLSAKNDAKKPPLQNVKDLCDMYEIRHDPDRLWSYTSPSISKCDAIFYGRFRFGSKYTPWSIKEGCDKNDMLVVTHRCGSQYQGFMEGRHPTVSEGYVERIICFQDATVPCECFFSTIVGVQNCSGFYVYDMRGVPQCNGRFCMVANNSDNIRIDPGHPPLYDIPAPGFEPVVGEQKKENKEERSLVASITVLSIILLILLILLIIVIIVLIFIVRPKYKKRKQRKYLDIHTDDSNCKIDQVDSKVSDGNGNIPREYITDEDCEEIPPCPSTAPPVVPSPEIPPLPPEDFCESKGASPCSDESFPELPAEVEHSDQEFDTLLKKEDIVKPEPYRNVQKDTFV